MSLSLKTRFQSFLLRNGLTGLSSTWRFSEEIPPDCIDAIEGREPVVIAVWHGSMLPVWYRFRRHDAAVLVSPSRDGELLTRYLERLGYRTILRGSSSKGGSEALAAGVAELSNRSLMVTPDGPRGPAREAKPGALIAAQRSGRRILAVGCSVDRAIRTRSWDRMTIPLPFSRIVLRYCILDQNQSGSDERISQGRTAEFSALLSSLDSGGDEDQLSAERDVSPHGEESR